MYSTVALREKQDESLGRDQSNNHTVIVGRSRRPASDFRRSVRGSLNHAAGQDGGRPRQTPADGRVSSIGGLPSMPSGGSRGQETSRAGPLGPPQWGEGKGGKRGGWEKSETPPPPLLETHPVAHAACAPAPRA